MYYEILEEVFKNSKILKDIPALTIDLLDEYIRDELKHGYRYLNPYKFSMIYDISTKDSIHLFLSFTDLDKLFKLNTFVDCPTCIGTRLEFDKDSYEGIIYCEECRNEYSQKYLKNRIYIFFSLNDGIDIPKSKRKLSNYNPNSTYDIINSSPSDLKKDYPLSSNHNQSKIKDKEDKGLVSKEMTIETLKKYNQNKGKYISKSAANLVDALYRSPVL